MKKIWEKPNILFGIEPGGDGEDTGGGTGQSGDLPFPCDFDYWTIMFEDDYDGNGEIDFADYRAWWDLMGFTKEEWEEWNTEPYNP